MNLSSLYIVFSDYVKEFRIYVTADEPINTGNKGRLVLGTMNVFFRDHEHFIDIEEYNQYDEYEHEAVCTCGELKYEEHIFDHNLSQDNDSQHKVYCICGIYNLETHNFTESYESVSDTQHKSICACGAYINETHIFRIGQIAGSLTTCVKCGHQHSSSLGGLNPLGSIYKVYETENGSYILDSGVVYLVDEDFDDYFNGTLIFNKVNNNELF